MGRQMDGRERAGVIGLSVMEAGKPTGPIPSSHLGGRSVTFCVYHIACSPTPYRGATRRSREQNAEEKERGARTCII
jgi:hypothetical protein